MRQFIDERKVRRYSLLARALSFGGLGVMGLGLLISFRPPYRVDLVLGLFVVGILASQIGLPLRNRWDRRPRVDEILDESLKGLDQRFAIFHYLLGARHVLICPGGVFALVPRLENGEIKYGESGWTRTGGGGLFRRGGTRAIRGIERQAEVEVDRARARLNLPFAVRPFVVFLHGGAEVDASGSPMTASHLKKLKTSIRKLPKADTLNERQITQLAADRGLA